MTVNTVFLRLEGPLQAWGDTSKFVIRRSMEAPTKSGVIGLICCAMGLSREAARKRLPKFNALAMAARIDRPGTRWWDYHTVGAGIGMTTAGGGTKTGAQGTLITRREYLADASFLVALQGDAELIGKVHKALVSPKWPLFLGRKSCPPSLPILAKPREGETWTNPMECVDLLSALKAVPWRPRLNDKERPAGGRCGCLVEWGASEGEPEAPESAEVWYDVPFSFDPPVHHARFVLRDTCAPDIVQEPLQRRTPSPPRPQAGYHTSMWKNEIRPERLRRDQGLCVFCKQPATTVQHVTYRRAGGDETQEDLRSLCRLCHDAVTMIEYGLGMGLDRINPEDLSWRDEIIRTRDEIVKFRSEETRRRALRRAPEDVRREVLEESEA
ncbi:MAG: type I-E CRISPR-associated protein Cas5/CasD [Candidatus Sumerlaeia bacterium]|nr:type I-E CRISPR-associated protein Cas5/CasD [Candidatus Sumerlaeia bacterium]